jgi:hypothetical protein
VFSILAQNTLPESVFSIFPVNCEGYTQPKWNIDPLINFPRQPLYGRSDRTYEKSEGKAAGCQAVSLLFRRGIVVDHRWCGRSVFVTLFSKRGFSPLTDREILGQGYTADIYPWGENRVIKLFHKGISESSIKREFFVSKLVETLGLNVPKVFERRQYRGRKGILYERIDGPTMTQAISQEPENIKKFAYKLADLHDVIHRKKGMGLPQQKDILSRRSIKRTYSR